MERVGRRRGANLEELEGAWEEKFWVLNPKSNFDHFWRNKNKNGFDLPFSIFDFFLTVIYNASHRTVTKMLESS